MSKADCSDILYTPPTDRERLARRMSIPEVEQTGLLEGSRCVSCRSYAIGFGGSTKHCHRIGDTVEPDGIACHFFDLRPGTHHGLPLIELNYLKYKVRNLGQRLRDAKRMYRLVRLEAKKREQSTEVDNTGYVYFIDCHEFTKIGFSSRHPGTAGRHTNLATLMPYDLVLWAYDRGPQSLERSLHKWFATRRVKGEWFRLTSFDRAELERLARKTGGKTKLRTVA
jgi:hypothetical protein